MSGKSLNTEESVALCVDSRAKHIVVLTQGVVNGLGTLEPDGVLILAAEQIGDELEGRTFVRTLTYGGVENGIEIRFWHCI